MLRSKHIGSGAPNFSVGRLVQFVPYHVLLAVDFFNATKAVLQIPIIFTDSGLDLHKNYIRILMNYEIVKKFC